MRNINFPTIKNPPTGSQPSFCFVIADSGVRNSNFTCSSIENTTTIIIGNVSTNATISQEQVFSIKNPATITITTSNVTTCNYNSINSNLTLIVVSTIIDIKYTKVSCCINSNWVMFITINLNIFIYSQFPTGQIYSFTSNTGVKHNSIPRLSIGDRLS